MTEMHVRAAGPADRTAVDAIHEREWGGPYVVAHDTRYDLRSLPTLVAVDEADATVLGALVWRADGEGLEVVSIAATVPGRGVGRALLRAAMALAREQRAARVWLITTNDNLRALRFYQLNGMRIVGVDPGAVDRARAIKPTIPTVGENGIALHDELLLEVRLDTAASAPVDPGKG
jgi:ribosomal protein S18 acetylase RimI-like enzyme